MTTTYINGHKCYYDIKETDWRYCDDDTSVVGQNNRKCKRCGNYETKEGYDFCLGKLPGVRNACCGHGVEDGYIIFENGAAIVGNFRIINHKKIKMNRNIDEQLMALANSSEQLMGSNKINNHND